MPCGIGLKEKCQILTGQIENENKTEKAFSPRLPELLLKLTMIILTDNYGGKAVNF